MLMIAVDASIFRRFNFALHGEVFIYICASLLFIEWRRVVYFVALGWMFFGGSFNVPLGFLVSTFELD